MSTPRKPDGDAAWSLARGGPVVVLSPHLDDAVLSIGALLARAARRGADVTVLTVLAGDPSSRSSAGKWDAACGFRTAGEAARARRDEDRRACELVGATPLWLPFGDEQYGVGADDETVLERIAAAIPAARAVLVPGFPLWHPDHRWLARLVVESGLNGARIGCYVEQPYTRWHNSERPVDPERLPAALAGSLVWSRVAASPHERLVKARACRAYRTQLPGLGRRPLFAIHLHELRRGGEGLAWLERRRTPSQLPRDATRSVQP